MAAAAAGSEVAAAGAAAVLLALAAEVGSVAPNTPTLDAAVVVDTLVAAGSPDKEGAVEAGVPEPVVAVLVAVLSHNNSENT